MEIATHPDDLFIQCSEIKDHPGKWYLAICRGRGHNYKPILTSDDPRSWGDSRQETLILIKTILIGESLRAVYESEAPTSLEAFIAAAEKWGFTKEWLGDDSMLPRVMGMLVERGVPMLGFLIDPERSLNAAMITEIMERFGDDKEVVDTSTEPLKSFVGEPTSPASRLD